MSHPRGRVIAAATDGACSGNPGPGGWGALIRFEDGSVEELGGHEPRTTNNRMELKAALVILQRLKNLPRHPTLTLRTDSKYLIDGLNQWMNGWKRKGWLTSSGKPVLNQDLWQALDQAQLDDVSLEYVKGHSGDPDNDRVDEIAVCFSKGKYINLQSAQTSYFAKDSIKTASDDTSINIDESAPPELQRLLSRLEIANKFATEGYGLTLTELSQLIEQPIETIEKKKKAWQWRDWSIEPIKNSRWRLRQLKQSLPIKKKAKDD